MKRPFSSFFAALSLLSLMACTDSRPIDYGSFSHVIPCPLSVEADTLASPFIIDHNTTIYYSPATAEVERQALFLQEYSADILGWTIPVKAGDGRNGIHLNLATESLYAGALADSVVNTAEGYALTVCTDGIVIEASTTAGLFYGSQTLRKALAVPDTLPAGGHRAALPCATIADAPRFAYRGAHLDCCRHFFPLDSVKSYLDMMALHNMNTFHWHLTDDQGWRIEIKRYPGLTEIGSKRSGTMIGRDFSSNDSVPYGGYYTQDEARELVRYAAERHIEVIPEIEMPGHMQGALAAYPQLGCRGGHYDVIPWWGISEDVLCLGNDSVVPFCQDILAEIMEVFPSRFIHIGGDECPKVRWQQCPKCQALIKQLGLTRDHKKSFSGWEGYVQYTPEQKLQSYFTHQIDDFITAHDHQAIGWDEILEGGISDNAIVMSWRGIEGGIEAARLHHKVIMVPTSFLYFDYYQRRNTEHEPLSIGGYVPIEKVYRFEPQPEALTDEEKSYIWGVQANIWTEYIHTFHHVQYMFLPRASALAELQWTAPVHKDYDAFRQRLNHMVRLYRHYDWRVSMQYAEEPEVQE